MRTPQDDRARLLYGPYQAPALKKGDRAFCSVCTAIAKW
jgi:hypothetical protein